MPKVKTNSAAKKRFKPLSSGKIKRGSAYKSHILTKKSTKRKRNLTKGGYISTPDMGLIKNLLGLGK